MSHDRSAPGSGASPSRADLVKLVDDYFAVLSTLDAENKRDLDAQVGFLAPDVSYSIPFLKTPVHLSGREAVRAFFASLQGAFSEIRYARERTLVDVESGVVIVEMTSERVMTKDGSRYANAYVLIFTIRDGLICDFREYLDPLRVPHG